VTAREAAWFPGSDAPAHLSGDMPADFGKRLPARAPAPVCIRCNGVWPKGVAGAARARLRRMRVPPRNQLPPLRRGSPLARSLALPTRRGSYRYTYAPYSVRRSAPSRLPSRCAAISGRACLLQPLRSRGRRICQSVALQRPLKLAQPYREPQAQPAAVATLSLTLLPLAPRPQATTR